MASSPSRIWVPDSLPQQAQIWGILNVTPDSFSDGGRFFDPGAAIARGRDMHRQGAHVIDVGGESTRPGAMRVSGAEERERVLPVVAALASEGILVSVDTMRAETAAAAIASGARIINDVSGGLADSDMAEVIAASDAYFVAMHWRGHSDHMADGAQYRDVVSEVCAELAERLRALGHAGIAPERIMIDPGLGFSKEAAHNWALLGAMSRLNQFGHPVLIGASRKRFVGALLPGDASMDERDLPSAVIAALAVTAGAAAVRVHDVVATRRALAVAQHFLAAASQDPDCPPAGATA